MAREQMPTAKRIRRKNRRNRMVFTILVMVLVLILMGGLLYILWLYRQADDVQETYQQIIDEVVTEDDTPDDAGEKSGIDRWLLRKINFDRLSNINSDTKTWVFIPHTIIDYPVVQEQKLNEYFYLHHNIYKSYSSLGTVFTPKEPEDMDDAHMLLFAHRFFYTNAMFSHLSDYGSKEYYKKHKYVYMYYADHSERWSVWAATKTNEDDMVYDIPYTLGSDDYKKLINHLDSTKLYDTGVTCDEMTRIVTLSTCRGNTYGGPYRFTLSCVKDCEYYYENKKLVKHDELPKEEVVIPDKEYEEYQDSETEDTDMDEATKKWIDGIRKKNMKR